MLTHEAAVLRFAERLVPIVAFVTRKFLLCIRPPCLTFRLGIFASRFPQLSQYYTTAIEAIINHPNLPGPERLHHLWGAFASCCINTGGRVRAMFHVDSDNYFAGLCVIIPFGFFDYNASARLVVDLGNGEVLSHSLPMGIPFFLPSAIVAHYNTRLEYAGDVRGSLVFWTSGKLFQWLALGGRAWGELSPAEQKEFLLASQQRWAEAVGRFPVFA